MFILDDKQESLFIDDSSTEFFINNSQLNIIDDQINFDEVDLSLDIFEDSEKPSLVQTFVGRACPLDAFELVYKIGRFGKFISCSNYPNCHYTEKINLIDSKLIVKKLFCPKCNNNLIVRTSRYQTKFIGCSTYPQCTYIMDNFEAIPLLIEMKMLTNEEGEAILLKEKKRKKPRRR